VSTIATRTRTFTWSDPVALASETLQIPGLEFVQLIAAGKLPPPPVADLLGLMITEVEHGRVVFAIEPAEWMYNPIGSVHGGVTATVLDSAMGCAVHTTLPAGAGWTTSDLQVRYLRPMSADTGRVLAEGRVIHSGSRTATTEGRMFTERDGSLIAHSTSGCILIRAPAGA
jgi:uncharacterized protein (TIGR00369 family)